MQGMRKALQQREASPKIVAGFEELEGQVQRDLARALRQHPLWPWLAHYPGLGGGHTALVIACIGDPRRFPGQQCTQGHYHPAGLPVGSRCSYVAASPDEDVVVLGNGAAQCPGTMLEPRTTTGVRAVWHYCGLMPGARKRKGVVNTWNTLAKTSCLQPGGIAEQIVRHRVPKYRTMYDDAKTRLAERGQDPAQAASLCSDEIGLHVEVLPAWKVDQTARKIAVKAFVGDLLVAWKAVCREQT